MYLFTAVLEDYQNRKVPNWWIVFGIGIGILAFLEEGELLPYLVGFIIPFILLFGLYCIRVIGAGDIKLLMVTGLFMGGKEILTIILLSFVFGGVYSFIKLLKTKSLRRRFRYLTDYIIGIFRKRELAMYVEGDWEEEMVLNFSFCIFLGALPVIGGML